jgi:hypothetical protein
MPLRKLLYCCSLFISFYYVSSTSDGISYCLASSLANFILQTTCFLCIRNYIFCTHFLPVRPMIQDTPSILFEQSLWQPLILSGLKGVGGVFINPRLQWSNP